MKLTSDVQSYRTWVRHLCWSIYGVRVCHTGYLCPALFTRRHLPLVLHS